MSTNGQPSCLRTPLETLSTAVAEKRRGKYCKSTTSIIILLLEQYISISHYVHVFSFQSSFVSFSPPQLKFNNDFDHLPLAMICNAIQCNETNRSHPLFIHLHRRNTTIKQCKPQRPGNCTISPSFTPSTVPAALTIFS